MDVRSSAREASHSSQGARVLLLCDELRAAVASPSQRLDVIHKDAGLPTHRARTETLELQAALDVGCGVLVEVYQPYKGPVPDPVFHRVDPDRPDTVESLVRALEHMFEAWLCKPDGTWTCHRVSAALDLVPDEGWVDDPGPDDLLPRLRALSERRGGSVAIVASENPVVSVQLDVRGTAPNLNVVATLLDDVTPRRVGVARKPSQGFRRQWRLSGAPGEAEMILAEAARALGVVRNDRSPIGPNLALRLETHAAAQAWRDDATGCGLLARVMIGAVLTGYVMVFLRWPETGIIADASRMADESGSGKAVGAALLVIAAAFAAGCIPATVAGWVAGKVQDRRRAGYGTARRITAAVAVAVYLTYLATLVLTPAWTFVAGVLIVPIGILGAVAVASSYLDDVRELWRPRPQPRPRLAVDLVTATDPPVATETVGSEGDVVDAGTWPVVPGDELRD